MRSDIGTALEMALEMVSCLEPLIVVHPLEFRCQLRSCLHFQTR